MTTLDKWVCTDPDQYQFGRKISDGVYEFKEFDWFSIFPNQVESLKEAEEIGEWVELTIDLKQYSDGQIQKHISAYYDNIQEIQKSYGNDWEWIVAECVFEQESQLY